MVNDALLFACPWEDHYILTVRELISFWHCACTILGGFRFSKFRVLRSSMPQLHNRSNAAVLHKWLRQNW